MELIGTSMAAANLLARSTLTLGKFCSAAHPRWSRRVKLVSMAMSSSGVATAAPVHLQPKKVLVPIANGTEEMEAVIVIDILRRAGADVAVASVEPHLQILASRNVKLEADVLISDCHHSSYDLVVLPGGMPGSERLRDSALLKQITEAQAKQNRLYAAICAAPVVALQTWGLLDNVEATCHPAFTLDSKTANSRVVNDGVVTTSRGPGTAMEFALSLVQQLYDQVKAEELAKNLVLCTEGIPEPWESNPQSWTWEQTPRALVPIAHGSEEMEVVIIVDVLRRAGVDVVVASVENELRISASRKVKIIADKLMDDLEDAKFDIVILPGGMPGATRLSDSGPLSNILGQQAKEKRMYGAICASPAVVLEQKQLLKGKKATCYPSFATKLSDRSAIDFRVVVDGLVVTSQGPGTSMEFALAIVEKFFGPEKAVAVAEPMVFPYSARLRENVHVA